MTAMRPLFSSQSPSSQCVLGGLLVLAFALSCHPAFAVNLSMNIADQASLLSTQLNSIPKLAAFIAYIIGVFYAIRGLLALRRFIDNPDENPLNKALGYLIVSALLIVLPYTIQVVWATFDAQTDTVTSTSGHFEKCGFGRNAC